MADRLADDRGDPQFGLSAADPDRPLAGTASQSRASASGWYDLSRRSFVRGSLAGLLAAATGCSTGRLSNARPEGSSTPSTGSSTAPPRVRTTTSTSGPSTAQFVARGPARSSRVALTFHTNGDVALAHQLLDLVDARKVPVTAFIVGRWLDDHPDWAKRLVDGGHELANHTYSHPTFARLRPDAMAGEITRCRDALMRTSGSGGRFFRPSGTANGTDTPAGGVMTAAGAAGYRTVLGYDVDPADYQDPGPTVVAQRTISGLHPGAIVSMHFGHQGTIQALPAILDALEQRSLVAVTASDLLNS